ncbi:tape measure protein [Plantibacter sp. YIM 135249]|uniref:tape measure protein n=1 Tax=Plantibacter sp. YIM 135249 TaxID=3423918 RepID=UPI003D33E250
MAEAAVAEVTIIPVSKGASKQIEEELGKGDPGGKAGKTAGAGFVGALGGALKGTATAVVGAAAAGLGVALAKGFGRLDAIDQARAKLTGLGNDTESVKAIMGDALKSVKGTSFGLGEAAVTAAGAVAAGIKPGEDLQKVLKSVANSASTAGVSMGEMGGIYNKVASLGKAQNDVLQQVADKGIPIYQALADNLGVTTEEVFKMASAGKIGFAEFEAAMTAASGTVAEEMGKTLPGSIANFSASLGRIGAGLLGGIFPQLPPLIQAVTGALAPLETKASALGDIIGTTLAPAFDWLIGKLNAITSPVEGAKGALDGLSGIIGPLAGAFVALGAGGLAGVIAAIPGLGGLAPAAAALSGPLGLILGALAGLVAVSPELRGALGTALSDIGTALGGVFTAAGPAIQSVAGALAGIASVLGGVLVSALATIVPFLVDFIGILGGVLVAILPTVATLITSLGGVVGDLLTAIMPLVSTVLAALLPAFDKLAPLVGVLLDAFMPLVPVITDLASMLISTLVPIISNLLAVILPVIPAILDLAMQLITLLVPVIQQLAPIVLQLIEAFLPLIGAILTPLISLISSLLPVIMPLLDVFISLLDPILGLLGPLLDLVDLILPPLTFILGFLAKLLSDQLSNAFKFLIPIIQGVVSMISDVLTPVIKSITDVLGGIITFITGVFSGNWKQAWDGIVQIFSGLWNGITGTVKGVINGIIDLINGVIGGINDIAKGVKDATGGAINLTVGKIPKLAEGGVISKRPGGILANIGEGKYDEAVVPLSPKVLSSLGAGDGGGEAVPVQLNQYITTAQDDPRVQALQWGREMRRGLTAR